MNSIARYTLGSVAVFSVLSSVWGVTPNSAEPSAPEKNFYSLQPDSDTLVYPFEDRISDKYNTPGGTSPLYLGDPSNVTDSVWYDPSENQYNINEHIGSLFYRNPSYLSFDEFKEKEFDNSTKEYFKQRAGEEDKMNKKTFAPKITVNSVVFDRIFGGNTIDIRPQGSAELIFALNNSKNQNPALPLRQRSVTTFEFKEKIQMNVVANIGDKMKLSTSYNTEATFEFENKMKLEYTGYEDDIIKKIEAGNVTLPLNSQLIQGSQSLFGIKTELQFGKMKVTSIFSQQKGKSQTIEVKGGAQTTKFEIKGDQYEANRHFFLAQYFRNTYEGALRDINQIRSGVNITRIEVWVRNTSSTRSNEATRNLIALADLGEQNFDANLTTISQIGFALPADSTNTIYNVLGTANIQAMRANPSGTAPAMLGALGMQNGRNYVIQENARMLSSSEYTFNPLLGYLSLNSELDPNKILAVAYEYTYNGKVYHVGELSSAGTSTGSGALFVKLLRSTTINPSFYTWDLMMKNVYNLNGYQIKPENFRLDVLYQDDQLGGVINYIPDGCADVRQIALIKLLGLDKINSSNDPQPDGVFDYKEGITINSSNGRIYFPVLEPFGSSLRAKFCGDNITADKYVYQALYDTTRVIAQQQAERNKFSMRGTYQSSSSNDIPLNAVNVPQGSVKVTAGGVPLTENVDYTVDYTLGRVKIINESYLKSNVPIQISLESQSLFSIQTKTMLGSRFDYTFNKDFSLGATVLHLSERPITQKVNIGDEPIANTVIGFDGTYRTESRFLTKMLDKLPLYNTKEPSALTFSGEVARLFPGHSKSVGKAGTSYIDDFEGAITPLDIKNPGQWYLASTPQGQHDLFPEDTTGLINGFNRAKAAWYYIDNVFQSHTSGTPGNITDNDMSNNFVREIQEPELFPNKSQPNGPRSVICTNFAFYPTERGPYNFSVSDTSINGATVYGIDSAGNLKNPSTRWGGIMRRIETTDFQNANIEYLQFWMMDPFADDSPNNGEGGDLYFNLGDISEDVLRDNHKSYENGIYQPNSANPPKITMWGKYPDENLPQIGYNFDFDETNRKKQDVGLDGLTDDGNEERSFFDSTYIAKIAAKYGTGSRAYLNATSDPSNDDFHYYLGNSYDSQNLNPLERYKKYNNPESNSPTGAVDGSSQALGSQYPDYEDLNKDFTLNTEEQYFQYHVRLRPNEMVSGTNYISDIVDAPVTNLVNHVTGRRVKWYQFKIPIKQPERVVGSPSLTYINAIRMFARSFTTPVILRFAKLEMLRGEWRKYDAQLLQPGEYDPIPEYPGSTTFDLSYVSIEENSNRQPVNYTLPPGIEKERDINTSQLATLNEQSLTLNVCHLKDGEARAAYKTTQLDIRSYKKLKMYIHAESVDSGASALHDGDMTAFIRLGSDFVDNYYEYELPLYVTQPGDNSPDQIWPAMNNLEINLDDLVNVKTARNNAMATNNTVTLLTPYTASVTMNGVTQKITVKGSPNLSNVRTMMIGLRNPKYSNITGPELCAEVWVNELRLSDFDEKGGWAATARVQAKLADLGNATIVGNHSTAGWGSLEQKVQERSKEEKSSYDIATNVELGKFLPEKSGIKVPMFFEYGEQFIDPLYSPLDPDVIFQNTLDNAPNKTIRDSVKRASRDYTQRKSINFTNVKKSKTGKNQKSHLYDIENFNFTYAYTQQVQHNYNIERTEAHTHQGIIGYNFNNSPKPIQPFSKSKALKSPYLRLIKDFNFFYAPTSVSLRASVDRSYAETQLRNNSDLPFRLDPTYVKSYRMIRNYGLNFDLTRSLKFDFNADAQAVIDEPPGRIDTKEERDSVKNNIKSLGRLQNYHHIANLTYNLPLNKIPITDFISANVRYSADYNWQTGASAYDSVTQRIGINSFKNTIQNSQTINYAANINFVTLYNKVPYLKKINQPEPQRGKADIKKKTPALPADSTKKAKPDSLKKTVGPLEIVFKNFLKIAMGLKSGTLNYSETNGILLPGFDPRPSLLGLDMGYHNPSFTNTPVSNAPGWGFIFGSQDTSQLIHNSIRNHWLTTDTALSSTFTMTHLQNLTGRATIEPIKSFKIDVSFNRNFAKMHSEFFRADSFGDFHHFNPVESGNFSISYLTWNSSFIKDASDYSNANFQKFAAYRSEVSQLLAERNPNQGGLDTVPGYRNGYGPTQSEVLTYSFLAAYSGKTPSGKIVERFPKIPKPNWRITYDGLSKLKFTQKFFQTVSLSHGYRSTYSINSFAQDLRYDPSQKFPSVRDTVGNFIPQFNFQQITIAEQFAPLIGVDITMKNSLQTRFEIKRDRTLTLNYANIQVTEVRGTEYTVGLGYKLKKFRLPFIAQKKKLSNDLNLRSDFSWRNNYTIIRKLVENANQPSAGSTSISVKVSADYNINERFNVKLFADKIINNPFVSTTFPTSNLNAGFSVRFTLAQ